MSIYENFLRINEEKRTSNAETFLKYLGNFLSLLFFITPLIQIIKAYKKTLDKEAIPLAFLIFIILNCLLWLLNAFSSGNITDWIPLLISNGIGIFLNIILLFLYLHLLLENNVKKFCFFGFIVINILVQITYCMFRYIILKDKENKEDEQKEAEFHYIGFAATIINILMYSSPIINIFKLFKTKSSDLLPIFTLCVGFLCTMIFLIQGVVSYNFYNYEDEEDQRIYARETIISNGISFFIITCQIGFWAYFHLIKNKSIKMNNMNERLSENKLNESQDN